MSAIPFLSGLYENTLQAAGASLQNSGKWKMKLSKEGKIREEKPRGGLHFNLEREVCLFPGEVLNSRRGPVI